MVIVHINKERTMTSVSYTCSLQKPMMTACQPLVYLVAQAVVCDTLDVKIEFCASEASQQ